jgi:hypothetical protein
MSEISGSNAGLKLLVEFMDQIHWSNLPVELLGQICRSNLPIKFLGQIAG